MSALRCRPELVTVTPIPSPVTYMFMLQPHGTIVRLYSLLIRLTRFRTNRYFNQMNSSYIFFSHIAFTMSTCISLFTNHFTIETIVLIYTVEKMSHQTYI